MSLILTGGLGLRPSVPVPVLDVGPGASGSSASFSQAFGGEDDFGVDVSTFPVLDTTFATIKGFRVLAEALARRLITPKGSLTFHPDYGLDLRQYINEAMDDTTVARLKQAIAQELLQDERVGDVDVTVAFIQASGKLLITCQVVTAKGPFPFVLALSNVGVELYLGAT